MIDYKTGSVILGAGGDFWQYDVQRYGAPPLDPRSSISNPLRRTRLNRPIFSCRPANPVRRRALWSLDYDIRRGSRPMGVI